MSFKFMVILVLAQTKYSQLDPILQETLASDGNPIKDINETNVLEINELPETGGPQILIDPIFSPSSFSQKSSKHQTHISLNGIPLDDDPLTLDIWEDQDEESKVRRRTKRSESNIKDTKIQNAANRVKHCDKTAAVDANGTKIVLCLNKRPFSEEDTVLRNYDNLTITVYGENTTRTRISLSSLQLEYVVGWVIGEIFSSVSGYILDNIFYGSIFVNNEIYYVDPLKKTMLTASNPVTPAILKDSPLAPSKVEPVETHKRKKRGSSTRERKICSLGLVSDHIFHKEVGGGDVAATVLLMLYHVKEANAVFITKDFDDKNGSDCVGFQVEAITILETEKSYVNILLGKYDVPEDFLRKFSRYNFAEYCLGLLFTNRLFKDLVLGLSWRGNPKKGGVGGTCQQRARYKEDGKTYSFNSLFISMRSQQQIRIPLRMAVLNLVHELMHAFGARHDPSVSERAECTPADSVTNGRYLMSKYSNNGRKHNHEVLSPCTKESVRGCLAAPHRVGCMKEVPLPYCGDGILDAGEECDCGDEFQCQAAKSCCNPPTGGQNYRPCTFRLTCKPVNGAVFHEEQHAKNRSRDMG